jgi:ferritin
MDKRDVLREVRRQITENLEEEAKKESCFLTIMFLDWLSKNDIISSEHLEMFLDECAAWMVANRYGLTNTEFLEAAHA